MLNFSSETTVEYSFFIFTKILLSILKWNYFYNIAKLLNIAKIDEFRELSNIALISLTISVSKIFSNTLPIDREMNVKSLFSSNFLRENIYFVK